MHSVRSEMWDPRPPSKHASPLPQPPPSNLRLAHVTSATPAKRITFYKSGDSQFGGIRMAVHKRSFKCFDALLDDLSQKVPLPFGVRTVTTPRGTHTIKHLEQLQDGGCYVCSDRRYAKPLNMELAGKRPNIWYHHNQRPHRPEASSITPPHTYRQRRILLVKNSEPGMRRSVVLSRRSTRSLRAFLDEVSEVMQFHVRKLYTAEGRRIDSIQSLITCPGVLVCVGREAFSPMLVNFIRKSSEEKLPGLGTRSPGLGPRTPGNGARSPATQGIRSPPHGAQSRASEYSEGHESKKNVNFGLETKKSIIHPRSDSSNRSTRLSLSSEKSYGNSVSAYSQARPAITNEDIEKRVLVNKDGSLSVEMRVRFRLHNDETLQWSTQIKKSPSLTNESCPLGQAQPHYLQQGPSESCSDPDSTSFDPEVLDYSSQPLQRVSEGNHCPCCYQRQEQQYDLWENPAHSHKQPVPPPHTSSHNHTMLRHTHSSSSSSSCNSRRVVRCRARLTNCDDSSGSKQDQLIQEEMCVTEQVEHRVEVEQGGDTQVEVHKVSQCCSRSEVVAMDSNLRPLSRKSIEDELMMEEGGDRPLSAVSSSSHVLQLLKEDQDDDLSPSASQCCHSNERFSSLAHLNDVPTRNVSAGSVHSTEHNKNEEGGERESRAVSAASSCHCGAATPAAEEMDRAPSSRSKKSRASSRSSKANIPNSEEEGAADDEDEETKRAVSGLSGHTGLSSGTPQSRASSVCPHCGGCKREVNSVSKSRASQRSSNSNRTSPNPPTPLPNQENANNVSDDDGSDASVVSTQSNKTNLTNNGRISAISNVVEGRASSAMSTTSNPEATGKEEDRAPSAASATSHRSNRSHKSGCNGSTGVTAGKEERSQSAMSAQSKVSAKSSKSHKSNCSGTAEASDIKTGAEAEGENTVERAHSSLSVKSGATSKTRASVELNVMAPSPTDNTAVEEDDTNKRASSSLSVKSNVSGKAERPDSVLSAKSAKSTKSNVSGKSVTSHRSTCSHCARAVSPGAKTPDEPVIEAGQEEGAQAEERAASAMSAKSNQSAKSDKSHKSKASERSLSPRSETGGDLEKRAPSQMSSRSVKSNVSVKSAKSRKSNCNGSEIAASPSLRVAEEKENEMVDEETQQRADSVMSAKLENEERAASAVSSKSHKSDCNENTGADSEVGETKGDGEIAEDRAASVLSGKSVSSAKSHHTNCDTSSRVATPAKDTAKTEVDNMEDRTPSAMSGKSHTSAKSSKSQKSNCTTASPNPNEADGPAIETNGEETQDQERVASAMSVKSKSSHKSNSSNNSKSVSPSPNVVTIKTPEVVDVDGNDTTERAPSAVSAKSGKSNASSRKSNHKGTADIAVIKTGQQLLPGETRGPSALSVYSTASAKSGRSKCCCGAALAKKEKEEEAEKKEDNEELKNEEASERPASMLSSSTKRQRRESGGTEKPLSRNSSGSIPLGLPEDQEADSDSGKSSVSFHMKTERKSRVKTATPDVPESTEQSATKEDVEETRSTLSQKSNNNGSKSNLTQNTPAIDIQTIETPEVSEDNGEEAGEQKSVRAASAISSKTSHKSCCKCSVKAAAQMLETGSVKSASTTKASNNRNSSAMSSGSAKVRNKSPGSAKNDNVAGDSANNDTENQAASRPASKAEGTEDITDKKAVSVHSKSPSCLRPESAVSAHSDSLNPVNGHKSKSSGKTSRSQKKEASIKPSSPVHLQSSRPGSKVETCSESTLSHSLSAADLLKETLAATHPHGRHLNVSKTSDKPRSEKSGKCQRSKNQMDQEELELTPACLPNASPSEVVSDWLRSIPANSSMPSLDDELHEREEEEQEKAVEENPEEEATKEEEESPEDEKVDNEENVEAEEEEAKEEEAECDAAEEEKSSDPAAGDTVETSRPNAPLLSGESLPRNWHSSATVMKVLLSSSTGRCRSMPEVSPVYGRRLSTSARGFLDCLAQLQLIDPVITAGCDPQKDRNQQYEDIMAILQSLWLTEPRDIDAMEAKDVGTEEVSPPRSSSGIGMSSGSGGSGKENGNPGGDETKEEKINEAESLHEDEEKVVEEKEEGNAELEHKENEAEPEETPTDQAKTDIAEEPAQSEEQSAVPASLDSPKATENPSSLEANDSSKSPTDNEETPEDSSSGTPPTVLRTPLSKKSSQDPDPVWILHLLKKLEKQFMNHYITAMAEFKVRWDLDDSLILDTMITELKDEVSRRIQTSIEREMKKIQGRAGRPGRSPRPPRGGNLSRESTMTEKRRQMLKVMKNHSVKTADSLTDGEMTAEFSDQRSDDEYCPCDACVRKKMAARPLKTNPLSAEAPVMMEFDLLKILQLKKSPPPAAVPTPAEMEKGESMFENEEARNLEVVEEEEEEDETKEDIRADVVLEETIPEEDENIEKEEDVNEAGEEEEAEGNKEENSPGDDKQEEGETGGEEAGEEETSENGEKEEEEEAQCQCQSARNEEESDKAEEGEEGETAEGEDVEETTDNTGEGETADDEEKAGEEEGENAGDEEETGGTEGETGTGKEDEESDKETVKEATAGEGETTENGEGEEKGEAEECEVAEEVEEEEKEEEEEMTSKESGEEEASGETEDDNAAKNLANEESTVAEEENAGTSAEAEDEDEGGDGTGEGESHEDAKEGENEEQEREASEEERASPQGQGVTEGEEADAEDSDTDTKRPSDTSADESGHDGAGATGDEEAGGDGGEEAGGDGGEEAGGDGGDGGEEEVAENTVEEFKPEEEEEKAEENGNKNKDGALCHQFTRTSVESQPGSLEDVDADLPQKPVSSIEVPKMGTGGGVGQRRSRSPARVKRRKPKECDVELDDI